MRTARVIRGIVGALLVAAFGHAHAQYALRADGAQVPGMVYPGVPGIVVADFDGDGRDDTAIAGLQIPTSYPDDQQPQSGLVAIVGYDAAHANYRVSQWLAGDQARLVGIASDHAAHPGLVLVSFDGVIEHYAGWPLVPVARIATGRPAQSMRVGDVDADGHLDVVIADATAGVAAYSLDDGTLVRTYAGRASSSIELVQLDADPALEIVLAGTPGFVVDGATNAMDWQDAGGFAPLLAAGRIVDAAHDGFIAAREAGYFSGYRGTPYSPIWSVKVARTDGVDVADIDGDGIDEILYSGDGGFRVYDARTQAVRESYYDLPLVHAGAARMKGGTARQYVSGARLNDAGGDTVQVRAAGGDIEYTLHAENAPFRATATADVSGDGVADAVWISAYSNARYQGGRLHVYDPATGVERWSGLLSADGTPLGYMSLSAVAVGPMHAAAPADIAVAAVTNSYQMILHRLDGATHLVTASNATTGFTSIEHLVAMPAQRLLAATSTTDGVRLALFDGTDLHRIALSVIDASLGTTALDVQTAPGIGAGVVLFATGAAVVAFDTVTMTVAWSQPLNAVSAAVVQRAGGALVVVALDRDGGLHMFGTDGEPLDAFALGNGEAGAVRAVPGDPGKAIACVDRRLVLADIDGYAAVAESAPIGALACDRGGLFVDAPRGGVVHVRASSLGGVFDLDVAGPRIFTDGFEASTP
ncbi:hypothetical protein FHW12_003957 [Dokdonella fugitiva]|uniref:FG-GAP repeat protein n=1 Tax=Dokdonella fugitiva TaxID=328517 RepID=A0A839F9H2_9GAMM|nr:hypothetical protein [Dokdonella fugitiva]MBA8889710.1 hypothetical protein [Dokdonella fugitiva]